MSIQIVRRALGVLGAVSAPPQGKTLTEISQTMDLPMPTTHRLLMTLVEEGYVRRSDESQRYFPGHALIRLASLPLGGASIVEVAQPHLQALQEEFGETVFLAELINRRAVCIASVASDRPLHVQVQPGRDLPLHASAGARALLAFRSDTEAVAILAGHDYRQFTDSTPRDERSVMAHLMEIRGRGYDICEDELDANVWAVAAPILQSDGRALASITVASPRERLKHPNQRKKVIAAVRERAQAITEAFPLS